MGSSWLHNWVNTPPLCCEMFARFFRDGEGLIDAGADSGAAQVVAGQAEAWEARARFCDCRQAVGVTEVVLRQGARPNRDVRENGFAFHGEYGGDLAMDETC